MIDPDDNSDKIPLMKVGSKLRIRMPADYVPGSPSSGDAGIGKSFTIEDYKEQILYPMANCHLEVLYGMYPPWPKCPVPGCTNNTCLALDSPVCFVHTPGWAWIKRRRIEWRRARRFWSSELPWRLRGARLVLLGKATWEDDE